MSEREPIPRTRRGRATRTKILEAAAELFHRRGVHATGLEDVLVASGTGKGQLYHYFRGKDDLVRQVVRHQAERIAARQATLLAGLDHLDGLAAWFDAVVESATERGCRGGCPMGSLASELADSGRPGNDGPLADELAAGFDVWRRALAVGFRSMVEGGVLPVDSDPEALADYVVAAQQGGMLLAQTEGSVRPLRRALDGVLDHLRGLARRRGSGAG